MVVCQLKFVCHQDIALEDAQQVITELLEELRYNGQIIGREFALTLNNDAFVCHLVCPEQDSLDAKYFTPVVNEILDELSQLHIEGPMVTVAGLECQSDFTDHCVEPKGYILYSTFVQSCSPIRCSEHFMPVPLYKLPEVVRKPLIKWQESHAACDQLQMNEMTDIEQAMLTQISNPTSQLMTQGKELLDIIKKTTGKATYQYLYRVGATDLQAEYASTCPSCEQQWLRTHTDGSLAEPLFGLFDFKCEHCGYLSNISWELQ